MSDQPSALEFGPFRLDLDERMLVREGQPVPLSPKAFELLRVLVENSGRLVTKDRLTKALWPGTHVGEANLTVNIAALRKALGDDSKAPRYVVTVPGRGYRFVGRVRESLAHTSSIAVLPLVNATGDPDLDYLCDGITESIINTISQLPQLRVLAQSTVFRYRNTPDPLEAGRALGVRTVLAGRVLRQGGRLIFSTELIDVATGTQLWGERSERSASEILAIPRTVGQEISTNLRIRLSGEEHRVMDKQPTTNGEAYDLYLRGRHLWGKMTPDGVLKSIEYYQRAIQVDPGFALAHAGVALSLHSLGWVLFGVLPNDAVLPKAEAAALAAVAIDPDLAEAHVALGCLRFYHQWSFAEADTEFRRAIASNPSCVQAHHMYGFYLVLMGRGEEAFAALDQALRLDPLSVTLSGDRAWLFVHTRAYDEAIEQARRTLELDEHYGGAHFALGVAYEQKGMYAEAIAELTKALELTGSAPAVATGLGHCFGRAGMRREAEDILRRFEEASRERYVSPYYRAIVHAGLGDVDEAFGWLEKAFDEHSTALVLLHIFPLHDNLRDDPRFPRLLRRTGFPGA